MERNRGAVLPYVLAGIGFVTLMGLLQVEPYISSVALDVAASCASLGVAIGLGVGIRTSMRARTILLGRSSLDSVANALACVADFVAVWIVIDYLSPWAVTVFTAASVVAFLVIVVSAQDSWRRGTPPPPPPPPPQRQTSV